MARGISLREFEPGDAPAVHRWFNSPGATANLLEHRESFTESDAEAWVEREAKQRLAAEAHDVLDGAVAYRMLTRVGDPTSEILRAEKELGVDLVVMATHGRKGVWRVALGSVAEKVVRSSICPVLTTRPA